MKTLINFVREEEGAAMAEYALLLGLITVGIAGMIGIFGSRLRTTFLRAAIVIR